MTLDDIIEKNFQVASIMLRKQKPSETLPQMLCACVNDKLVPLPSPFESIESMPKKLAYLLARKRLHELHADAYAIISEAWIATETLAAGVTVAEAMAQARSGPPLSQRLDRRECLIIYAENRTNCLGRLWSIERDSAGRIADLVLAETGSDGQLVAMTHGGLLRQTNT